MDLCVLLVNWRNERATLDCVKALRRWSMLKPQIVVVDNQSTETSRDLLSQALMKSELICSETNLGYGGGNNLAIQYALKGKARYLLLLNSDAAIREAAATSLVSRLETNPDISMIGPVIYEGRGEGERCCVGGRDIALNTATRMTVAKDTLRDLPGFPLQDVDYVPGTVFLARKAVFEQVGQFDERFFFGGEVADFCRRATRAGHRCCVDLEVSAWHDASHPAGGLRETLYPYYSLRNRFLYARKHYPSQMPRHLAFWTLVSMREFGLALGRGRRDRARAILLALAHGYANRSGNQNAAFL